MKTPKIIHINRSVSSKTGGVVIGIAFMLLSIFFFVNQTIITFPFVVILFVNALYHLIQAFKVSNVGNRYRYFFEAFMYLALSWIFMLRNQIVFLGFGIFLVIWSLVNAFIKGLNVYIDYQTHRKLSVHLMLIFLSHLLVSIVLIIFNINLSELFIVSLSSYLLFYGADLILSSIVQSNQRRRLPSFLSILLPDFFLRFLQSQNIIEEDSKDVAEPTQDVVNIYVHLGDKLSDRMGHVDIGYNGRVYTYGNHDPNNRNKYFLWGNGILGVVDEERFISYSVNEHNKRVFKFVYQLTESQKRNLEQRIQNLMSQTKEFTWVKQTNDFSHYLPMVNKVIGSDYGMYYEFDDASMFKKYNILKVNCVLVSYYLINDKQEGLFKLDGIISPGAYFETLMYLYNQKNSPIIEMSVLK